MSATPLHHLALGARDIRLLGDFYQTGFALPLVQTHRYEEGTLRSLWLRLGDGVLMIERTEDEPRLVEGIASGIFLLTFGVSEGERELVEERVRSAGGQWDSRSQYTTYGRDPEGNRVALSSYPLFESQ